MNRQREQYSNEQFTYSLWSVSLLFSSFPFFVVGLFWFSSFSQSVAFFFVLFLYLSIFLLSFRVSFVLEVLHSVSDSLFGRFFDRLVQFRFGITPWGREPAPGTKPYMLYSHIHIHNTNISGNIVNNNDELQ